MPKHYKFKGKKGWKRDILILNVIFFKGKFSCFVVLLSPKSLVFFTLYLPGSAQAVPLCQWRNINSFVPWLGKLCIIWAHCLYDYQYTSLRQPLLDLLSIWVKGATCSPHTVDYEWCFSKQNNIKAVETNCVMRTFIISWSFMSIQSPAFDKMDFGKALHCFKE